MKSTHSSQLGMNRTGVQMSPIQSQELTEATEQTVPTSDGDEGAIATQRMKANQEMGEIGSVPLPGSLKAAVNSTVDALTGKRTQTFLDLLGERLAFERSGVRLYDAVIAKCESRIHEMPDLPLDKLRQIRADEQKHFAWLTQSFEELGADPTAQTPAADVAAVASMGLFQVATDPRTTIIHGLHCLLHAELADNAGWENLILVAEQFGKTQLAERFRVALEEETEHLATIRSLYDAATLGDAKVMGNRGRSH